MGNPLVLSLTGGQVHDIIQAEMLTAQVRPEAILGDKGYDADSFISSLEVRAIKPIIPPKSNRKKPRDCDFALYAERNLVEPFSIISSSSEVSPRATRKPHATSSRLHLVCALAWLK